MASSSNQGDQCYRRLTKSSVAAICKQCGFDVAEDIVLETLTEMMISYLSEAGRTSKTMAELAGRTQILPIDTTLALIDMGFSLTGMATALKENGGRIVVPGPRPQAAPAEPKVLRVGKIRQRPAFIPDFLPPFPDPHTYCRTQPQIEYQVDYETAREITATQQRNMETSLVKYMLNIQPAIKLHATDNMIAVLKPTLDPKPYLAALLPPEESESRKDATELDITNVESSMMDNPYLRPVRMPTGQDGLV